MQWRRRSSQVSPAAPASIIVMTSVSEEVESPTPLSSSFWRSSAAFTRLPLWATASGP